MNEQTVNWLWFIAMLIWFVLGGAMMFTPTGDDGEWKFIDYFHLFATMPTISFFLWRAYKKVSNDGQSNNN
jgi:hypothetical protein